MLILPQLSLLILVLFPINLMLAPTYLLPAHPSRATPVTTSKVLQPTGFVITEKGTFSKNHDMPVGQHSNKSSNVGVTCTTTVHPFSARIVDTLEPVIFAACLSFDIVIIIDLYVNLPPMFSGPFRAAKFTMVVVRSTYANILMPIFLYYPFMSRECTSKKISALRKYSKSLLGGKIFPDMAKFRGGQTRSSVEDLTMKATKQIPTPEKVAYLHRIPADKLFQLLLRILVMSGGLPDPKITLEEIARLIPKTQFHFASLGLFWAVILSWGQYILRIRNPQDLGPPLDDQM